MEVRVVNLTKEFGDTIAVDNLSFTVSSGEILTLLGPSGCGKTTTLRCIAGLESIDGGEIHIGKRLLDSKSQGIHVPPEKRGLSMVFQSYAVWPHMTVFDNVSFGLKVRKSRKEEVEKKVREALDLVGLKDLEDRYPGQLSGGQQQRVALARSITIEPDVLLLDEPLSNLDAKLRESTRIELRELCKKLGMTAIYVTHDQAESMAISDRIMVMNKGRSEQIGTPYELYFNPRTNFVADFIGIANLLSGTMRGDCVDIDGELKIKVAQKLENTKSTQRVLVSIKAEQIDIYKDKPVGESINVWEGIVRTATFQGNLINYWVKVGSSILRVQSICLDALKSLGHVKKEDCVYLQANPENCIIIPIHPTE